MYKSYRHSLGKTTTHAHLVCKDNVVRRKSMVEKAIHAHLVCMNTCEKAWYGGEQNVFGCWLSGNVNILNINSLIEFTRGIHELSSNIFQSIPIYY